MELNSFLHCLFEEGEGVCYSATPRGTFVQPLSIVPPRDAIFFSINPLHKTEDKKPTESYHAPNKPRRADHNVTSFRNILIEMDKIDLYAQETHIININLPYSTRVYSGGKSNHYIISLETPLNSRAEYNRLVSRIYHAVGMDLVDQSCRNPSRFSRLPGVIRPDTNKLQELLNIKGRVNNNKLEEWLISRGVAPLVYQEKWDDITYKPLRSKDLSYVFRSTREFIMFGKDAPSGTWNRSLFKAAADLCRNGWNENEAIEELTKVTGTLDATDLRTISSAFNNEENSK